MNESIISSASARTWSASGATRLAVNTGSSSRRYLRCSSPSRPSGIAGRLLPRYLEACSTSWCLLTKRMSSMRSNTAKSSRSHSTGHRAARSTYIAMGSAVARAAAPSGSLNARSASANDAAIAARSPLWVTMVPLRPAFRSVGHETGRITDVREQLLERAQSDALADRRVDTVEELVQRLLRVAERALEVRIVAAPHHVVVPHRPHRSRRGLVVLERRVHLTVEDLLRQHRQHRAHEHVVLAVPLVHPIADEWHPARAALR